MNAAHATDAVPAANLAVRRQTAGTPGTSPARRTSTAHPAGLAPSAATRDADGMAVASFLLGLPGLLVMNVVLGPAAVVLALVALARGTARRGRALLGLALGVADLAVFAALTVAAHGVLWSFS